MRNTFTQLKSSLLLLTLLFSGAMVSAASPVVVKAVDSKTPTYEGNVVAEEGAWCWFADPRAIHYENAGGTINSSYIGYIDVHGNIKAMQHNFLTGKNNEVLVRSYFQPDDHDNPTFLVLPDERVMIFYSRHTDECCFYYRISKKPGDITALGEERKIRTTDPTTYPSAFLLSADPKHFYLCWRGIKWHPTIAKLNLPDADDNVSVAWGPYQMVQSTGARPYCKYESNGKDKIYLTYTTAHPDVENPNWVYFSYVDITKMQLKDVKGTVLSTIGNSMFNVSATPAFLAAHPNVVVDNPSLRDWIWQTAIDKDGSPVMAIVQISDDKAVHNYYYAKWTGKEWRKTFLAFAGGKFHQTDGLEKCYSAGMAIDDSNPSQIYCSQPVEGTSGKVYELVKYTIAPDGTVASTEQITTNSTQNNIRPFVLKRSGNSPMKLAWMHGEYHDWIVSASQPLGYCTSIHSDFALPTENVDLTKGLTLNEDFSGTFKGNPRYWGGVLVLVQDYFLDLKAESSPSFSLSITPHISNNEYGGVIFKMGNLTYSLNSVTLKPYLTIDGKVYSSENVLGTSDVWQTEARVTEGTWWAPTKLGYFNLTLTYENGVLKVYRNGLIDQVVEVPNLTSGNIKLGGFIGNIGSARLYNRALNQTEIKALTKKTLAFTKKRF